MWLVRGTWVAIQSNGWRVTFELDQNDGSASVAGRVTARHPTHSTVMKGAGSGNVTDAFVQPGLQHQFKFDIAWDGGPQARYVGTFGLDERLTGVCFPPNNPGEQATWFSDRGFVVRN